MSPIVVLLLFVAYALIVHGLYEDKLASAAKKVRIEYRFLPRTLLDEQLSGADNLLGDFSTLFEGPVASPWDYVSSGRASGTDTHARRSHGSGGGGGRVRGGG